MKAFLLFIVFLMASIYAHAADRTSSEIVLARYQDIQVTQEDLEHYIAFRVAPEKRAATLASPDALFKMVESIFMVRYLAAQTNNFDAKQLAWQVEFQRQLWLSDQAQENNMAKAIADINWDTYAKEAYIAQPEKFMDPKQVDAAHILVSIQQRTREEAAEKIKDLQARVDAGEDFNKLAEEYSDDPSAKKNRGELGVFTADKMVPAFSSAVFAMTKPGTVSNPVETAYGFHLIKLNKLITPEKKPFEKVKDRIVKALRAAILAKSREQLLLEVRSIEGLVINREALNQLSQESK